MSEILRHLSGLSGILVVLIGFFGIILTIKEDDIRIWVGLIILAVSFILMIAGLATCERAWPWSPTP